MSKQFDPLSAPATGGDDTLALDAYAERAYLEYAMSVVKGRALKEAQVKRAIELSAEKYCSASIMLGNAGVKITHDYEIVELG